MRHFFAVYKGLEGKYTVIGDAKGREAAISIIQEALDKYRQVYGA